MSARFTPILSIGLMSGTSGDGIDAALVRTDGEAEFEFLSTLTMPYEPTFREQLLACARGEATESMVTAVDSQLTKLHADAVSELIAGQGSTRQIDLIGFHGHTIAHQPERFFTRQIGDGERLAELVDTSVIFDFRSEDMRNGGQGAPLAPLFHAMLFADLPKPSVVLNLGGVANVTWLDGDAIVAGDTGPGCGLLDEWVFAQTGRAFDCDGQLAQQGIVDLDALKQLTQIPYFSKRLPKSADRFEFGKIDVSHLSPADGAATLCAVTATTVADAIATIGTPTTTWVTGGGAKHPVIMRMLAERLGEVRPAESAGMRSDSLEAECFAWLAVRRLRSLPTTLPTTTGCKDPTCGGTIVHR